MRFANLQVIQHKVTASKHLTEIFQVVFLHPTRVLVESIITQWVLKKNQPPESHPETPAFSDQPCCPVHHWWVRQTPSVDPSHGQVACLRILSWQRIRIKPQPGFDHPWGRSEKTLAWLKIMRNPPPKTHRKLMTDHHLPQFWMTTLGLCSPFWAIPISDYSSPWSGYRNRSGMVTVTCR